MLVRISLPDATSWQYDFPYFSNYAVNIFPASRDSSSANRQCNFITGLDSTYLSVKHPTGATVKLNIGLIVHGSSDVPASYNTYSTAVRDWIYNVNACNAHIAVSSKEISGPRLSNYIWHYNYSNNLPHWSSAGSTYDQTTARFNTNALVDNEKVTQCSSITECAAVPGDLGFERFDLRVLTLTAPDETFTKYYISKRYDYTENQIIATEHFSGTGDLLRRQINSVVRGTLRGDNGINFGVSIANIDASSYPVRKIKTRIVQEGDTYTTLYSDFNAYDVPQQSHQLNDFNSKALYLKTDFTHDTTHWVLNLPTHSYRSDSSTFGTAYQSTSYNSLFKPYQKSILGAVVATYTYNAQGEVAKITYNGSGRSESFEHYYRGRPQKITLPCALTNGCDTVNDSSSNTVIAAQIVNNDGTVQRLTDFNGHQISYSYNAVGWLTKVDYTDPAWSDQTIAYALVNTANDGISGSDIPVGSWRQTITQGNYQKRTYFDGLLRPIFTREMDVNNSATERYQAFQYDDKNRQTFTSFPSGTAPNPLGIATRYDVLGRMLSKTRTSDHSEHSYQYLAGNRIEKTDPNGYATTTTYLAYGSPEQEYPVLIKAADTDDTTINYNFYDQITSITQGHITEYRLYNAAQLLCKTVRPETGITAMGYNTQRQLIWRAEGTTGSTTSCDETAVNASHKVSFSYDNQNQLRTEDFPDAAPDRTYRYDPNGNLLSLSAGNVNWSYLYNSRNLLEKETLTLDSKTFVLDWAYNSLGAISSLIYPTGTTITYAPNALGQPTQAGTYATGISYFPNGEVKQWTYGNGIVRTVQQDSSGRTDMLTDALAAVNTIKLDPAYDNNDNLTQLLNLVDSNYSVTGLTYDAANRLQTANGQWGSGRFTYDGLGNLTSRTYNSTTLGLAYNHLNRLNNLTGAATHSYAYDDRGNITHNGQYALSYNRAQQITSAKSINYVYDGYNRRVKKTNAAGAAYTVYSKSGQLLYRELPDTKTVQSIYLGTKLIAEIDICHAASCGSPITQPATVSCSAGYLLHSSGTFCYKTETTSASVSYTYGCPSGFTLSGSSCSKNETVAASATTTYSCASGFTLSGSNCVKNETVAASATITYSCASGFTLSGTNCVKNETLGATVTISYSCPSGGTANTSTGQCTRFYTVTAKYQPTGAGISCYGGFPGMVSDWDCTQVYTAAQSQSYSCSAGWNLSGTTCSRTLTQAATSTTTYACAAGWNLSATTCNRTLTQAAASTTTYACAAGWNLSGTTCNRTLTQAAASTPVYSCAAGWNLSATTCSRQLTAELIYSCPAGWQLTGSNCIK